MRRALLGLTGVLALTFLAIHATTAGDKVAVSDVTIDNFNFSPQTLTVAVGTKVTWINRDDVPHTVTSIDKKTFVSSALDTDEKFAHTFTTPGTNDYYCSVHPHMKGRIIVR